jgi:hypothetical protein
VLCGEAPDLTIIVGMVANLSAATVERALLTDPSRCPSCGSGLFGRRCGACGVDLSGPEASRLWDVSSRAARLLDQRELILGDLRRAAARATAPAVPPAPPAPLPPAPPAPAVPRKPRPSARPPAVPPPAGPAGPATPAPPARGGGPGVHGLLLGLGALLLSVAAVGFLVFSWQVLSLAGRAAVIGGCTLGVLAVATWLRPRLPETGEAIGALGAVLVVADAWAVRSTGLWGADSGPALGYAAAAAAVCAVILGGWALAGKVRAASIAAALLAPLAVALAGAQAANSTDSGTPFTAGLVAAAALAAARRFLPAPWGAERVVLRIHAGLALALALLFAGASIGTPHTAGALLLLAAALVAVTQALADRAPRRVTLNRDWSVAAGVLAAAAAVPAARAVVEDLLGDADERWLIALVPAGAGLVTVALAVMVATTARSTPRPAALTAGASGVLVLATVPAVLAAVTIVVRAADLATRPWATGPGEAIGAANPGLGTTDATLWTAALLGLVACALSAVTAAPQVRRRSVRVSDPLRVLAAVASAFALVTMPLAAGLRVDVAVLLLVVDAAVLGVAAYRLRARVSSPWLYAGSTLVALLAVAVAWSTRPLSVPVTLLAAAAALFARRAVTQPEGRVGLSMLATGATVVVAGAVAGLLGRQVADRLTIAGAAGALLAAALLTLPGLRRTGGGVPAWLPGERLAAAGVAAVAAVPGLVTALSTLPVGGYRAWRAEVVLAALLALALAVCAALRADVARTADLRVPAAFLVAPVASGLVVVVAQHAADDPDRAVAGTATAAALALTGAVLVLLGRVAPGPARTAFELGTAVTGAAALLAVPGGETDRLWLPLLLLGTGAAAVAAAPDRRRVGWAAGVLLTASSWARLAAADVGLVEAYTVPPALALLGVAALRLRRDPAADAIRQLAPGAALALVPSVIACQDGPPARPAALLGVAALLVALAAVAARTRRPVAEALLGAGVLTAAGVAAVRGVSHAADGSAGAIPWTAVEPWAVGAALVVAAAAVVARPWGARVTELLLGGALLTATVPSVLAAYRPVVWGQAPDAADPWRAAGVLAAGALVAVAASVAKPSRQALTVAALLVAAAGALTGTVVADLPVEVWTLPLAAALLAAGAVHLARTDTGSWPALGPGLGVALLPSLVLSLDDSGTAPRAAGLVVLAAVAVLAGARLRLQAPAVGGAVVLAVHAVVHLWPYLAAFYAEAGLWVTLAIAGVVLLAVGAQYERRLRQLRLAGLRLAALR